MELHYKDISPLARSCYAVMKTLGLSVTLKELVDFNYLRSEEFLKLNPAHQIPVLVDNGFVLSESRAILTYLINQYAPNHPLYPTDAKLRAKIDQFLYYDGTNYFPAIRENFSPRSRQKAPTEEQMQALRNSINEMWAMKGSNKFMAGNQVSLADISIVMNNDFIKIFFPEEAEKMQTWVKDVEAAVPAVKEIQDAVDFTFYKDLLKSSSE